MERPIMMLPLQATPREVNHILKGTLTVYHIQFRTLLVATVVVAVAVCNCLDVSVEVRVGRAELGMRRGVQPLDICCRFFCLQSIWYV